MFRFDLFLALFFFIIALYVIRVRYCIINQQNQQIVSFTIDQIPHDKFNTLRFINNDKKLSDLVIIHNSNVNEKNSISINFSFFYYLQHHKSINNHQINHFTQKEGYTTKSFILNPTLLSETFMFCILMVKENHTILVEFNDFTHNSNHNKINKEDNKKHDKTDNKIIFRLSQNSTMMIPYHTIVQKQIEISTTEKNQNKSTNDLSNVFEILFIKNRVLDWLI